MESAFRDSGRCTRGTFKAIPRGIVELLRKDAESRNADSTKVHEKVVFSLQFVWVVKLGNRSGRLNNRCRAR